MPEKANLNPDIRELSIGVRELRNVTVYPLSVRDQLKTSSIVSGAVVTFFKAYEDVDAVPETDFATFVASIINGNLDNVVKMALADEPVDSDPLAEMTNKQLEQLVTMMYEVNYSFLSSLFQKLTSKMKTVKSLRSMTSFQTSATDTDTDPMSSMESRLEMEDLLSSKQ